MELCIDIQELSVSYNGQNILKNINLRIEGPGIYFIIGPNGSGKSTLLRALANLIPFEGKIKICNKDVREFRRKELAQVLGYVWQNPLYGFFEETVEREIQFILKNIKKPLDKVRTISQEFNIEHLLSRSPFYLSGGEAKRVSIASVVVADQNILLLDEPESAMDLDGIKNILNFIHQKADEKLIIIATHNILIAKKLSKKIRKIVFIKDGKIFSVGDASLLDNDRLLEEIGVPSLNWWLK
ncbi:MAG: energy-coupling factor ABC transporter ATP-binding protein [Candidatus Njordarchaeum guaymaensis]